jgi:hypothetical protein
MGHTVHGAKGLVPFVLRMAVSFHQRFQDSALLRRTVFIPLRNSRLSVLEHLASWRGGLNKAFGNSAFYEVKVTTPFMIAGFINRGVFH